MVFFKKLFLPTFHTYDILVSLLNEILIPFVGSVVITAWSGVLQVFPQMLVNISNEIAKNRRWAQILAVATICICYVTTTIPLFMEVSQSVIYNSVNMFPSHPMYAGSNSYIKHDLVGGILKIIPKVISKGPFRDIYYKYDSFCIRHQINKTTFIWVFKSFSSIFDT